MTLTDFRNYCLAKPGVTEDTPFGPDTLVLRVMGKMFALTGLELFTFVNLKCDPERALDLRDRYTGITPGYHMSKKHWNSVLMDGSVPQPLVKELIDHSYELVRASLPAKVRKEFDNGASSEEAD